jgi:hypothetical protein
LTCTEYEKRFQNEKWEKYTFGTQNSKLSCFSRILKEIISFFLFNCDIIIFFWEGKEGKTDRLSLLAHKNWHMKKLRQ